MLCQEVVTTFLGDGPKSDRDSGAGRIARQRHTVNWYADREDRRRALMLLDTLSRKGREARLAGVESFRRVPARRPAGIGRTPIRLDADGGLSPTRVWQKPRPTLREASDGR